MTQSITITLKNLSVSSGDLAEDLKSFINLILSPHVGISLDSYEISVDEPIWFEPKES